MYSQDRRDADKIRYGYLSATHLPDSKWCNIGRGAACQALLGQPILKICDGLDVADS